MGALISDCGKYRHWLNRTIPSREREQKTMVFVMLNPSTADAEQNDPTIRKCIGFTERQGFNKLIVVNLFDYRATNPKELKRVSHPCSQENFNYIRSMVRRADMTICGWGTNGTLLGQNEKVLELLKDFDLYALRVTKNGHPGHPLFIPYDKTPILFRGKGQKI